MIILTGQPKIRWRQPYPLELEVANANPAGGTNLIPPLMGRQEPSPKLRGYSLQLELPQGHSYSKPNLYEISASLLY